MLFESAFQTLPEKEKKNFSFIEKLPHTLQDNFELELISPE